MIDPKYAHLPGIDRVQPDVFETSDLPESDQPLPPPAPPEDSADAEHVDTIRVDVKDIYSKFKDKRVDGSRVDFSDSVASTGRSGYDNATEFQLSMDGKNETLEMRFKRLQLEMQELSEDVTRASQVASDESKSAQISPAALHQHVVQLQSQLHSLQLQKNVGGGLVNLSDADGNIQKKLLSQIEQMKAVPGKGKDSAAPSSSSPSYELYVKPEVAQFSQTSRVADLEQRIAKLEVALGSNPEKLAMLTAEDNDSSGGLLSAVSSLQTKVNLLNPKVVDQVDGRLGAVQLRLQQIDEKQASNAAAQSGQGSQQLPEDTSRRIAEIHALMGKWERVCGTLPNITDRMVALNDLHNQALTFGQTLAQVEAMQKTIGGNLTTQTQMVAKVEATLATNLETIRKNCAALDERMRALQK